MAFYCGDFSSTVSNSGIAKPFAYRTGSSCFREVSGFKIESISVLPFAPVRLLENVGDSEISSDIELVSQVQYYSASIIIEDIEVFVLAQINTTHGFYQLTGTFSVQPVRNLLIVRKHRIVPAQKEVWNAENLTLSDLLIFFLVLFMWVLVDVGCGVVFLGNLGCDE